MIHGNLDGGYEVSWEVEEVIRKRISYCNWMGEG